MSTNAVDVFNIPVNPALESKPGPQIYQAMIAIMRDTAAIGKDSRNQQQGFNYRGIDSVYNTLHNILARHGVFMTSDILEKSREERVNQKGTVLAFTTLRIKYTFWAGDGSKVYTMVEGEGMDSGDKSSNKAMAIAHKYALLQAFLIPTEEIKDPDAESHEVVRQVVAEISPEDKETGRQGYIKAMQEAETLDELREAKDAARAFALQCKDKALWEEFKSRAADLVIHLKEKTA